MNKEKAAAAKALFMEGYNCSQAVVGAWLRISALTAKLHTR